MSVDPVIDFPNHSRSYDQTRRAVLVRQALSCNIKREIAENRLIWISSDFAA
jgi:hypothetical protein